MSSIHPQDNKLVNFPEQWENSWLVTKENIPSRIKISLHGTPQKKFENKKLSVCLLWRQIEPLHDVQKLAKSGVPYICILDITGGI